jgi:hypothetical protein
MLLSLPGECILLGVVNMLLYFQIFFLQISHLVSSYIKN